MKYSNFFMNIYDEDSDPNHENSLLDIHSSLNKLLIRYEINTTPSIEFIINTISPEIFMDIKNMYVLIKYDDVVIDYNIGIVDQIYKSRELTIYGFLCNYDNIRVINSSYLGSSLIGCIEALNIKPNLVINGKDGYSKEFNDDFPFDYWKIQESDIQAINKILPIAYPKSIYSMNNNTIFVNTIDYGNDEANYLAIAPDEMSYISKSEKIEELLDEDTVRNPNIKYNVDDMSGLTMSSSMHKQLIGITNRDSIPLINYSESLPLITYSGDILIKGIYKNKYVPFELGNSMRKLDLNVSTSSNWFIINKIERYSFDTGITSAILFSAK